MNVMIGQLFDYTYFTMGVNMRDVTHEQSLVPAAGGGNCMNWVLGHILATRVPVLRLAGAEPVWTEAQAAVYRRGSAPITGERVAEAMDVSRLLADLATSQERLKAALSAITPARLEEPGFEDVPGGVQPVGRQLGAFAFHESYHAGQLGVLRRAVGLAGAIR